MMHAYGADNINQIVAFVNDNGITKAKIVSLLKDPSGTYTIVYFD